MALNRFSIIGRLTCPPVRKSTFGDKLVATLDIIVNRRIRQGEAASQRTDLFRVTTSGQDADSALKYLGTGSSVYVEGRLEARGEERARDDAGVLDLIAERIEYLSAIRVSRPGRGLAVSASAFRERHKPAE